jgi:hypothetical protein
MDITNTTIIMQYSWILIAKIYRDTRVLTDLLT